jgi:hypothetical protein
MGLALFDFECPKHGIFESLIDRKFWLVECPVCGKMCQKIISACRINTANDDAQHIREAANALIDRDTARFSDDPVTKALAEKPTRSNLNAYLKDKKIRYAENEGGAPPRFKKPEPVNVKEIAKDMFHRKQKRDRLEVHT